jgi:antibiotic biosynthesis monooxygenase (ABM) superfamily enzyme
MRAERITILTSKVLIQTESIADFAEWQANLHALIAQQPGFVSLEILSPIIPKQPEWLLVQKFYTQEHAKNWQQSEIRQKLMERLKQSLIGNTKGNIKETLSSTSDISGGATEMFITKVNPDYEKEYHEWMAKIHQAESKFPGFKGVYVQSPSQKGSLNWITLLQFDTLENLDNWLNSSEREKILEEGKPLMTSLENHRMISPYAGWFASIVQESELPAAWKQTMLVLLVLYPIVVIELKYLSLWTAGMNLSLSTFIGNAISVTLIAWPMMPIAIYFLGWWFSPKPDNRLRSNLKGTILILVLYLIEIALFWDFL